MSSDSSGPPAALLLLLLSPPICFPKVGQRSAAFRGAPLSPRKWGIQLLSYLTLGLLPAATTGMVPMHSFRDGA